MNKSNILNQWQRTVCTALSLILILSMLWIPARADVSASPVHSEEPESTFICRSSRRATTCYDQNSGTKLTIPRQRGVRKLEVITTSADAQRISQSPDDEFTAHRNIMGLNIINSKTGEALNEFNPALRIETGYTRSDVRAAGRVRNLTLGYFNGAFMQKFSNIQRQGNWRQGIISAEIKTLSGPSKSTPIPIECPIGKHSESIEDEEKEESTGQCVSDVKDRGIHMGGG